MKKQLIMAALGLAMAGGLTLTSANAAPLTPAVGASESASSAVDKVHYRRHHHNHRYGHHYRGENYGWRRWRPRMFGYLRHRHHGHNHHNHYHNRRHYH